MNDNVLQSLEIKYGEMEEKFKNITSNRDLVTDLMSFISLQFNSATLKSYLNDVQYQTVVTNACDGLLTLLYITHYPNEKEISERDTLYSAAMNYIFMIVNRIYLGRDRELDKLEIQSRQPINYITGAR